LHDYEYHLVEEVRAGRMTRRELVRRGTVFGLSLPTISMLLAACGGGDTASPSGTAAEPTGDIKPGGVLKLAVTEPGADVDPITMFDSGGVATAQLAGEYLAVPDKENNLVPTLASEWNPGETPKDWTFTIREGVQWQDGSPLTADDVVATFDRITDPEGKASALSAYAGILTKGNIEKTGDMEVTFHLERPFADFPYLVSSYTYGAVILPKNYEIGQYAQGGVGTGPYIIRSVNRQRAIAEKNPNYWQEGKPYMDRVELRYYADVPPQVLAMQAGEAHIMMETPFQGAQALFNDANIKMEEFASSAYRELHMRVDQDPWKDKRVRQAVAWCIDREGLVQTLWEGHALPANDHGFAPHFNVTPEEGAFEQRKQDHEKAKALLAEAGHEGGVKVDLTAPNFLEIQQYVTFVKEQCRPAGIDINLKIVDINAYYGSGDNQPWLEVPFGCVDWAARGVPSQLIVPAYTCKGVWNSAHWCNDAFDKAMADLDAELDEGKRKELATQAAEIQHDEVPAVISYWITQVRAMRKDITGMPGQFADMANVAFTA
jgi:peptide/nickel transport system substrate-binding protein